MAANKGLQYENAVMAEALARIWEPTLDEERMLLEYRSKVEDSNVENTARRFMDRIWNLDPTQATSKQFYRSFKKLGGGRPEPKTDILFIKNGQKYRCSLKYGGKWQFSSAGIQGNITLMNRILQKISVAGSVGGVATIKIAELLEWLQDEIALQPTKQVKSAISPRLAALKQQGGTNEQLERILGGKKNAQLDPMYSAFKREFIRENLTGGIAFGTNNDACANYVLDMENLYPITDTVVNSLLDKVFVELRLKGRGFDPGGSGERLNEIVLRVEQTSE